MSALDDVKGYMEFWGWTDGGGPGSVKIGLGGETIARHGDVHWIADVENVCNTLQCINDRAAGESVENGKEGENVQQHQ